MSDREFQNKFRDACFNGDYQGALEMLDEEQYLLGNLGDKGRLYPAIVDWAFKDACYGNRVDIMNLLIDRASPVFKIEQISPRALVRTCELGCIDAVRLLLDKFVEGIVTNASVIKQVTYAVCIRGDTEMASLLLERCGNHVAALMFEISCMEGDMDIVSTIMASHTAILEPAISNMLVYLCARGDADMVELLLNRCGWVFTQNDYDASLRAAYLNGHEEITAILRSGHDSYLSCSSPKPIRELTQIFVEYEWYHMKVTLTSLYSLLYSVPYYRAITNPWEAA